MKHGWILFGVVIGALALRLVLFWEMSASGDPQRFQSQDSGGYIAVAQSLLQGELWSTGTARTPGYPLLLIPGILLKRVITVTVSLQILLSCLTVVLTYRLGLSVFRNRRIALLSAALFAIEPLSVFFSNLLLTETLFLIVFTAFLLQFLKSLQSGSALDFLTAGCLLGVTAYVRPATYYLPLFLLIIAVLGWLVGRLLGKRLQFPFPIKSMLVMCMAAHATMGLWQVRNYAIAHYSGFSSISEINLYYYHAGATIAVRDHRSFQAVYDEFTNAKEKLTPSEMKAKALVILRDNPICYARAYLKGTIKTLFGILTAPVQCLSPRVMEEIRTIWRGPAGQQAQHEEARSTQGVVGVSHGIAGKAIQSGRLLWKDKVLVAWLAYSIAVSYGIYILFGIFLWHGVRRKCNFECENAGLKITMLLGVIVYVLAVTGPAAVGFDGRFRLPFMPILSCFAGFGMWITLKACAPRLTGKSE